MGDWTPAGRVAELSMSSPAPPPIVGGGGQSAFTPPSSAVEPLRQGAPIPNYLWQSIVITFLCCLPFGIPAIVYAAKVDGLAASGNVSGAMAASANAKKWCWIAGLTGVGVQVIILALVVLGAATSAVSDAP